MQALGYCAALFFPVVYTRKLKDFEGLCSASSIIASCSHRLRPHKQACTVLRNAPKPLGYCRKRQITLAERFDTVPGCGRVLA